MYDILSFNNFIAQDVLIFFYCIGAIAVPALLYYYKNNVLKFLNKKGLHISLSSKEKRVTLFILIMLFLCAELCWRMVFEAMTGYFDMHDYLYEISKKIH